MEQKEEPTQVEMIKITFNGNNLGEIPKNKNLSETLNVLIDKKNNTINLAVTDDSFLKQEHETIIKHIIEYINYYKPERDEDINKPLRRIRDGGFRKSTSNENYNFINTVYNNSENNLLNMILVADYLNIEPLVELTAAKIADVIRINSNKFFDSSFEEKKEDTSALEPSALEPSTYADVVPKEHQKGGRHLRHYSHRFCR